MTILVIIILLFPLKVVHCSFLSFVFAHNYESCFCEVGYVKTDKPNKFASNVCLESVELLKVYCLLQSLTGTSGYLSLHH